MDGVQLSQGYRATKRRQFTFYYSQQQKIFFQKLLLELLYWFKSRWWWKWNKWKIVVLQGLRVYQKTFVECLNGLNNQENSSWCKYDWKLVWHGTGTALRVQEQILQELCILTCFDIALRPAVLSVSENSNRSMKESYCISIEGLQFY